MAKETIQDRNIRINTKKTNWGVVKGNKREGSTGFEMIPRKLSRCAGLTLEAKAVYSVLFDYQNIGGVANPSIDTLMRHTRLTNKAVMKATKELVDKKFIWKNRGYKTHSEYTILPEKNNAVLRMSDFTVWLENKVINENVGDKKKRNEYLDKIRAFIESLEYEERVAELDRAKTEKDKDKVFNSIEYFLIGSAFNASEVRETTKKTYSI